MNRRVIEIRSTVWGYETVEEFTSPGKPPWQTREAYNPFGDFIGSVTVAQRLHRLGIAPERNNHKDRVCSVGYSSSKRAWYGWGLGKIKSFRPGSKVSKGDELQGILPAGYVVRTWDRARWCARIYAELVNLGDGW